MPRGKLIRTKDDVAQLLADNPTTVYICDGCNTAAEPLFERRVAYTYTSE